MEAAGTDPACAQACKKARTPTWGRILAAPTVIESVSHGRALPAPSCAVQVAARVSRSCKCTRCLAAACRCYSCSAPTQPTIASGRRDGSGKTCDTSPVPLEHHANPPTRLLRLPTEDAARVCAMLQVLNRCRDLARHLHLYRDNAGASRVALLVALLCAFPRELKAHLVGGSAPMMADNPLIAAHPVSRDGKTSSHRKCNPSMAAAEVGHPSPRGTSAAARLAPPLPPALTQRLCRAGNRPMYICKWLASEVTAIPDSDSLSVPTPIPFTSRERLFGVKIVNQLSAYVGACERLVQTPVPLNYARHTSRFLTLWCLTLPVSLVGSMGMLVVPVTAFVTWCLFGIQEIGA